MADMLYKMEEDYLKTFKPRWWEDVPLYGISIIIFALSLYALYFTFREQFVLRGFSFFAIYVAVMMGTWKQLFDLVGLIRGGIRLRKSYNKIKKEHEKGNRGTFIDEGGHSEKKV